MSYFKVMYKDDYGIHEDIVGAPNEFHAIAAVMKEHNYTGGQIDIKDIFEIKGEGVLVTRLVKKFEIGGMPVEDVERVILRNKMYMVKRSYFDDNTKFHEGIGYSGAVIEDAGFDLNELIRDGYIEPKE